MFNKLGDWIFNRALRLSHRATVAIAKRLGASPERVSALNDLVAGVAADRVQAAQDKVVSTLLDGGKKP